MLTSRHSGTRPTKATHDLDDRTHPSPDRAAKRRRTETSRKDVSVVNPPNGKSLPVDSLGPFEQSASEDVDGSLRELRAQLNAHPEHDGARFENGAPPAETFGQLDPEMTKAISNIIDHSERFEQCCAMGAAEDERSSGSKSLVFAKTGSRMKVESLPILDNLVRSLPHQITLL